MSDRTRALVFTDKTLAGIAATLAITTAILLRHRYEGIWHDSVLYLGQALEILHPQSFRHDLFFLHGSQASYTIFPELIAQILRISSAGDTFLWLTLLGLFFFAAASLLLVRSLLEPRFWLTALLALVVLPSSYGISKILAYSEPFFTGRSLAEPVVLLAMAALVRKKYVAASIAWMVAAFLHPLQALPFLAFAWFWLIQENRHWLYLPLVSIFVAGGMTLAPSLLFIFERMDPIWFDQVWQRNSIVFVSSAHSGDIIYLVTDIFIAIVAAHMAQGKLRRYLISIIGSTTLLFACALLLADHLRLAWPTGLQLWRVHWLLHWSAVAVLPWTATCIWHDPRHFSRSRLILLLCTVALGMAPAAGSLAMVGAAVTFLCWPKLAPRMPHFARVSTLFVVVAATFAQLSHFPLLGLLELTSSAADYLAALLLLALIIATIFAQNLWINSRVGVNHALATICLAASLVYAGRTWDQRSQENIDFTSANANTVFGFEPAPEAQVLWIGSLLPAWSVLQRAHYIDQQQLAGIVFNRGTSIEGFRRRAQMRVVNSRGHACQIVALPLTPDIPCWPDEVAVNAACSRAKGQLTYVVLPYPLTRPAKATWTPSGGNSGSYHLYACAELLTTQLI